MIALLNAQALRMVAPLILGVLMVYAFCTITAGVVRTTTRRHAAFWSPPRPLKVLAVGRRTEKYRRLQYAATEAKHAARTAVRPA